MYRNLREIFMEISDEKEGKTMMMYGNHVLVEVLLCIF
jgi:hypothetical protein